MNEEEVEVLKSIYESDPNFSVVNENTFQYKFILDDERFYLTEIHWPDDYPNVIPKFNLDLFSNRLLTADFKRKLIEKLTNEANEQLGMPMTYTLFESIKDFAYDGNLFQTNLTSNTNVTVLSTATTTSSVLVAPVVKKEQLTKSQKRRQWNHRVGGDDGQKPRGYDWVEIVRHLSQTANRD
ncbi:unnamed protein product [Rotaria socialis]|uniref:RWD domain-containing protein n=1 Tax=Rotaria socialis TaxID=392032 RepID=A0A817Z616_9BILA|nr:unnamed protein product [Rotaria socialis]CAF3388927.1 unnamed protein product [Rotaria socialis]CAF4410055.1 unnamed protein product [Rotaria socialis]CAF4411605.1 unnamed protein product [Rotaria socialis]